ncbi:hypothetical protein RN001_015227 [Aquatica leii]|uniref:Methyltransferase type 11 domain-containing protein n=1 Tax=Aquatica leii TaxID=1421715 RepID=A0AAN7QCE9_9COLE|nr:hypothetical protein RN001_015227 [Aquatica leii]
MNHPSLYLKQHQIGRIGSTDVIQKYFYLVSQNKNEEIAIVDIGSGPGNVTHDDLIPLFKAPIRKVVGIDASEKMVEFANATYGNEKLSFEVLNIENVVPERYTSFFDYVFSFFAYHWIKDQRQLFLNINRIMKPNGQMLFSSIAQSILFDIYQSIWRRPEYAPYIDDFDRGQSCFQKSKEPVEEFRTIIESSGFEVVMIKMEEVEATNISLNDYKELLIAISPYYDKMPNHLKENFLLDHLEHVQRDTEMEGPNNYYLKFNMFVVYAKKINC